MKNRWMIWNGFLFLAYYTALVHKDNNSMSLESLSSLHMPENKKKVVLVTGGSGLVGHAMQEITKNDKKYDWFFASSKDADLTSEQETMLLFKRLKPTFIIHLAANVGGLFKNLKTPATMLHETLLININVLNAAHQFKVEKVISCLSTCIFPHKTTYPINENMLHDGPPHFSNFAYAHAKRMLEVQSMAYQKQHGDNFQCVIPTNIFGPNDNFNLEDGHVIPALIHKCYIAMIKQKDFIVFGSGKPLRQFIYSLDVARIILNILESKENSGPIIASVSEEISIKTAATTIARKMGFKGKIVFDTEKSDGQYKKTANNDKLLKTFPETSFTNFETAIERSIQWFIENYETARK